MSGYEESPFKTSGVLPFVGRHRPGGPAIDKKVFHVQPSSVELLNHNGFAAIVGALYSCGTDVQKDVGLKLIVQQYSQGVFRITIDDLEPLKHERHVPDSGCVLDGENKKNVPIDIDPSSFVVDQSSGLATLTTSSGSASIVCRIQFSPFTVEIYRVENGPQIKKLLVAINSQNYLRYDTFTVEEPEIFGGFTDVRKRGAESVGVDISFPMATHLHGLPERTSNLSLPDTIRVTANEILPLTEPYRLYNIDKPFYESNDPFGLYGSIPLLYARTNTSDMSKASAVGVFWHNTSETYVDVSSDVSEYGGDVCEIKRTNWYSETGLVDMFVLPGPSAGHVLSQYFQLTGKPAKMPFHCLGYHQCRYSYMSELDVRAVDKGFDDHQIPYDVMWLDIDHTDGKRYFTWNYDTFPNPTKLREDLQSKGRQMVTIIDPHVKVGDPSYFLHQIASYQRLYIRSGSSHGPVESSPDGDLVAECWPGKSSWLDFNDEKVRRVWSEQFNEESYKHFGYGMYVWNDMNEPSTNLVERTLPKDGLHRNGTTEHRHVHNVYGHDMVKATYQGLRRFYSTLDVENSDRVFVLTRAFFAGSQRYAAVWTGDNTADWDHLHASIRMLLTLSICGVALCGADVGGFFGNPNAELFTRWYQVGAFQPFFRGHSMCRTDRREPWLFGEPFTSIIKMAIRTRYKYLPYWITLFESVNQSDVFDADFSSGPPMRPLWWTFPEASIDDETCQSSWMVGDALFVAPVLKPSSSSSTHTIIFPDIGPASSHSSWYDVFHPEYPGKPISIGSGDQCFTFNDAPLDRMFVFQVSGTVVPTTCSETAQMCTNSQTTYQGGLSLSIALDSAGCASGDLFVVDIDSISRVQVEDGVVKVLQPDDKSQATSKSKVVIKDMILLGVSNPTTMVGVDGQSCVFGYCPKAQSLKIENLALAADGGWRIEFN